MTKLQQDENPHLKKVGEIAGHFFVPAYQRGYRWGQHEIEALLDDIYKDGKRREAENYCLQPIVVKWRPTENCFELIDGQQRLTTLYLIYHYLQKNTDPDISLRFSLSYQTRPGSAGYLISLDPNKKNDNIDFFHMQSAYYLIGNWFEKTAKRVNKTKRSAGGRFYEHLQDLVHVIWYEAGNVDSVTLFTRLNVGRIPLTNAELIKALLLARQGGDRSDDENRQIEISSQWDMIERELREESFWAFLTNKPGTFYPTRIEFLFDLIARKAEDNKERFYTFLHFKELLDSQDKKDPLKVWKTVLEHYQLLREWFENRDLYHKVGYLVAIGNGDRLSKLVDDSKKNPTKTGFRNFLDKEIMESIDLNLVSAKELSYDGNYNKCERLLLLFNVESVRRLEHSSDRYPFHSHKTENWSLEHIHAQHAEPLNTEKAWRSWLDDSKRTLHELRIDDPAKELNMHALVSKIDSVLAGVIEKRDFNELSRQVMEDFLNDTDAKDSEHSIANLALLSGSVNSALNNGAFQAKRRRVIQLDREGRFIPLCTRRVFFKYYTETGRQQMYLWSREDQESYVETMLSPVEGVGKYLWPIKEAQS